MCNNNFKDCRPFISAAVAQTGFDINADNLCKILGFRGVPEGAGMWFGSGNVREIDSLSSKLSSTSMSKVSTHSSGYWFESAGNGVWAINKLRCAVN